MSDVVITTLIASSDRRAIVDLTIDGKQVQLSPNEARILALDLLQAAESAIADAFVYQFLDDAAEQDDDAGIGVLRALNAFREFRAAQMPRR